jgi:hypothetical protein
MFRSPLLKDPRHLERPLARTLEEKRILLVNKLLTNVIEARDIPSTVPLAATYSIDFLPITSEDVYKLVLEAGNTAPSMDEIPIAILQAAWPLISTRVLALFQQCLLYRYYPACFWTAILAIISKLNKTDLSSPQSYCPIALLSVLGKGLERLLAWKMLWLVVTLQVINS